MEQYLRSIIKKERHTLMTTRKCRTKDCNATWEIKSEEDHAIYCSIECACYDGAFSVKKGWLKGHESLRQDN